MPNFQPINVGNILATGEGIRGARLKNQLAQQQLDPNSRENQLKALQLEAYRKQLNAEPDNSYTLTPGAARFDAQGQLIAERPVTPKNNDPTGIVGEYLLARKHGLIPDDVDLKTYATQYKKSGVTINNGIPDESGTVVPQSSDAPQVPTPWMHIADAKTRAQAQVKFGEYADKEIERIYDEYKPLSKLANRLERFVYLNKNNETGGFVGNDVVSAVRKPFDAEFNEMSGIVDEVTPQMRQGLPGAASDRDISMFRGATVGTNKPRETNENINKAVQVAAANKKDQLSFFEDFRLNNGHLVGAKKQWRLYLEANPIFDHNAEKGSFKLNPNRQTYQEYFSGAKKGDTDLSNLSDAELEAMAQRLSQ